jgi:hypothetical protein
MKVKKLALDSSINTNANVTLWQVFIKYYVVKFRMGFVVIKVFLIASIYVCLSHESRRYWH